MRLLLARAVGGVFRVAFAGILLLRRPRPIHSRGVVLTGEMTWLGTSAASGISWIDEGSAEPVPVVARVSRSVGLPAWLPDVIGLALRVEVPTAPGGERRPADLELASTGFGVPSRFVLAPQRRPSSARFTTLLPYRSDRGSVLVAARTIAPSELPGDRRDLARALAREPWRLRLFHAGPTGKWHGFAEVELRRDENQADAGLRFDRVRNPLPGSETSDWVVAMHQPSYRLTRAVTRAQGERPARARRSSPGRGFQAGHGSSGDRAS